jgi:hypothetical protein
MAGLLIDQQPLQPHVRTLRDSRPPCSTWAPTPAGAADQPPLAFETPATVELGPPRPTGHRVHVVSSPRVVEWPAPLPDPRSWSASVALAVAETLQGRRPVGQLSRWVDEQVLATLNVALRHRRRGTSRTAPESTRPAVLRSVHLQYPQPTAVEASAHVQLDGRSAAFAFRLEAWYDRWLCTALELGPRSL